MESNNTTLQDEEDNQPLDITPMAETMTMMDPYELFSTPPSEMVLSSTPSKQPKGRRAAKAPGSARKAVLNKRLANRASISFDSGHMVDTANISSNSSFSISKVTNNLSTSKPTRVLRNRNVNRSKFIDNDQSTSAATTTTRTKTTAKQDTRINKQRQQSKKQSKNLWDKCLKSNPELAQFVDNFNQSLEEALSKPLDMSGNE